MLFASCDKESLTQSSDEGQEVNFTISTDIATKAAVSGTSFTSGSSIGLFLFDADGNTHTYSYNANIKATAGDDPAWAYYFSYSSDGKETITLDSSNGTMDCYAYYPYISSVTDITSISFDMSSQYDLMYASNTNIAMPEGESTATEAIGLSFNHSLSLINLSLTLQSTQSGVTLEQIMVANSDGDGTIVTGGTYNAKEGTFNPTSSASFTYNNTDETLSSTTAVTVPILIYPSETEISLDITLNLDGVWLTAPITIPAQSYTAGTSYTVTADIDNYAKFGSITVDDVWTTSEKDINYSL